MSIRPFASVAGIYDNGLIAVGRDREGRITNPGALYGIEGMVGAYGAKEWRRTHVGLDYMGLYRHYNANTFFNGSDHLLGLDLARQLTRRTGFTLRTIAGTTSRAVGGVFSYSTVDPLFLGVPANEIFDNRTYFLESIGSYLMQFGSRNTLSMSGSGFAVRRQSRALVGINGYRATADFTRRVTRNTTVGGAYQYFHVDFPRVLGEADVHVFLGQYSRRIARVWDLSLAGGLAHLDFTGVRQVTLDPVVAELLGYTTGREAFNSINRVPTVLAGLGRSFRRALFSVVYQRGVSPGNGVLLLSRQESLSFNYTYNTGRRWSVNGGGGYFSMTGTGAYAGTFETYNAGMSANYRFWEDLHFSFGVDVRRLLVTNSAFGRTGTRVFAGLTYSPGPIPVSIR
ncbi:MAG: hypothetical protein NZV14_01610 [Bryobacteraceae bacterium]|nr:hypothetical protein [Bryobacteraceae bacterium]MDW8376826.1 hypothetical protein [Bryobacterales bacterium]